jgi:arylsulfatase A-like enzyme
LRYVDAALSPLLDYLQQRRSALVIVCSDHGTAYGEDGYFGHRHAHPVVMHVPYAHFLMGADSNTGMAA